MQAASTRKLDLFIDNVQAGVSSGEYTCLASNSEGSVEARSQVVLAVPAVITTLPRNQTRLEGERLELACQAKALPANITYKWFFNQKPLHSLKWFESRYSVQPHGTLVINSLYRDDQGEYKCQATNGLSHRAAAAAAAAAAATNSVAAGAGAKQQQQQQQTNAIKTTTKTAATTTTTAPIYAEASAYVTVEFPARITFSPQVQYLPLGLSGLIRCYVQAAPPVEFWTWTKNNSQFDPNVDQNIERLTNGSLLVRQVSRDYEGTYRCTPFNKHGSAGSSAAMEVRVHEPPYFELRPAEFYKATLNGQVRIPCSARGIPRPQVSWRKVIVGQPQAAASAGADQQMSPQQANQRQTVMSGDSSSISAPAAAVLLADEAASTAIDETASLAVASATITDDTGAAAGSKLYAVAGQQQQQLQNSDLSSEQEQQQSVINYAKLPSDRSEYKNAHLSLHHLKKEDHGRYECVIENEVATLVASTMLYVEGEFLEVDLKLMLTS